MSFSAGSARFLPFIKGEEQHRLEITKWITRQQTEKISVTDFGAVGDGVTDDTQAISAAAAIAFTEGVTAGVLWFPPGKTYLGKLTLTAPTSSNTFGEKSLTIQAYGAILKGRSADSAIIDVAPPSGAYVNGLTIKGASFDMGSMANLSTTTALSFLRSYNNALYDLKVINEPTNGFGLSFGNNCYTTNVIGYHAIRTDSNNGRASILGVNNSSDQTTTIWFRGCSLGQLKVSNAFDIAYTDGLIQGSLDHFVLDNCNTIIVTGNDLEGTGGVCYNLGANVRGVISRGNTPGGYTNTTYASGTAYVSDFADRPVYSGGIGVYAKVEGTALTSIVSSAATTTIYPFQDISAGAAQALFMVCGDNGSDGFGDLVMLAFSTIVVVQSNTMYGSPPARSYSFASSSLRVALASAANANIRCTIVQNLGSTNL